MPVTLLMMPPQNDRTREWGDRLGAAHPDLEVIVPETMEGAEQAIATADAAFGTIPPALLARAQKLRWLQAPQAAPPAGYYYRELIEHPVVVTNFREIYNDHIGAHVMAFVLAFARGLHVYLPQQQRREWKKLPPDTGVVHLPEATALSSASAGSAARWLGSRARSACGSSASMNGAVRRRPASPNCIARTLWTGSCRKPISSF